MSTIVSKYKGFILAAGYGSRLKPITLELPKSLVPFLDEPLMSYAIRMLSDLGINEIAVNASHLAEKIEIYLKQQTIHPAKDILYSYEGSSPLGTSGCYPPVLPWLADQDLICINCDVIADFDIVALLTEHEKSGADLSMMTITQQTPGKKSLWTDASGKLMSISEAAPSEAASPKGYACLQVISKKVLEMFPCGYSDLPELYSHLLDEGIHIHTLDHQGFWADLGTPKDLVYSQLDYLSYLKKKKKAAPLGSDFDLINFVSLKSLVAPSSRVKNSILLSGAKVEQDASVTNSLILDGAVIAANQNIVSKIVGKNFEITL